MTKKGGTMTQYTLPLFLSMFLVLTISMTALDTTAVIEDAGTLHTISYNNVLGFADTPMTELAVIDAVMAWNDTNDNVHFVIVEHEADVKIVWRDYVKDSILGEHKVHWNDEGEAIKHRIIVWFGADDCNLEYQLLPYELLKHTIMHEMGHYLGLGHTDDEDHLMYSHDMSDEDLAQTYDDLNLNIPYTEKPKIPCV